ncbi:PRELI-like family-domain-containing protein [Phakopsora pachyrhizi]|nr:PRELI-like family-domain-containing protein [Phakopsora pachyrhizi]
MLRIEKVIHSFQIVCQAYTLRYPNPFSPHVITCDAVERSLDASTGVLSSTRLVLKRGTLPKWVPRGMIEKAETWVLEESYLNLIDGTLTLRNRNIDHRFVMDVIEKSFIQIEHGGTTVTTHVKVTSSWGFQILRRRIENYGIGRFQRQSKNSRHGLEMTILILQPSSPLRQRLLKGEKINYPPAMPLRARLHELRRKAEKKRQLLSEIFLGGTRAKPEVSLNPDLTESVEDSLSAEEEAELMQLEEEFNLESPENLKPIETLTSSRKSCGSRWFWWWRWHSDSKNSFKESNQEDSYNNLPQVDGKKKGT